MIWRLGPKMLVQGLVPQHALLLAENRTCSFVRAVAVQTARAWLHKQITNEKSLADASPSNWNDRICSRLTYRLVEIRLPLDCELPPRLKALVDSSFVALVRCSVCGQRDQDAVQLSTGRWESSLLLPSQRPVSVQPVTATW